MKTEKPLGWFYKALLITSGVLATAYVGTTVLMGWFLVRPRKRGDYDCIPRFHFGHLAPITLTTTDDVRLHAWVLLSDRARPQDWVVVLHGYRSDRIVSVNRARFFSRRGYNVLLLHFRGHGSSQAARISYGYHERRDVRAAFDFIRSVCADARIGIVGISMGAAAAAYAVAHGDADPAWMILESCYDNIRHALANRLVLRVGYMLTPLVAWPVEQIVERLVELRAEDLDPGKALEKARCPILMLAGDSERVLKLVEIEYLFGCIQCPKRLVLFEGAAHEDLLAYRPRQYARAVVSFLKDLVGDRNPVLPSNPATVG